MTPEQLIERMVDSCFGKEDSRLERMCEFGAAKCMLRIVLKAIEEGEVVESIAEDGCPNYGVELKPSFKAFMEEV